jgi:hypothetical protein
MACVEPIPALCHDIKIIVQNGAARAGRHKRLKSGDKARKRKKLRLQEKQSRHIYQPKSVGRCWVSPREWIFCFSWLLDAAAAVFG